MDLLRLGEIPRNTRMQDIFDVPILSFFRPHSKHIYFIADGVAHYLYSAPLSWRSTGIKALRRK